MASAMGASIFDEIKDKLKIEDVIGETVRLKRNGNSMTGFCPFHENHKTPALAVWSETGTWKCFAGCGQGDVFDWVEKRDGVDKRGALELLARKAGVELGQVSPEQMKAAEKRKEAAQVANAAAHFFVKELGIGNEEESAGLRYARSRGWAIEATGNGVLDIGYFGREWDGLRKHLADAGVDVECPAAAALVGYRGDVAAWGKKWHVQVTADEIAEGKVHAMPPDMLMYLHVEGKGVVYVSGRRLADESATVLPKSWNPPERLWGKRLPFYNRCFKHGKPTVVVEGQGDAVTLGQWGLSGVGLCGLSTDNALLSVLEKCERVTVALDSDEAGRYDATGLVRYGKEPRPFEERVKRSLCWRLVEQGLVANQVRVLVWPEKDANDCLKAGMNAEWAEAKVKDAETFLDVMMEFAGNETNDEEEREEARLLCFDLLAGIDARWVIGRKKEFAKALDYDLDTFDKLLVEARRRAGQDESGRPLYAVSAGRMVHNCFDRMGNPYEQALLNGSLAILKDMVVDDGEEQQRVFTIEFASQDGRRHASGEVDVREFGSMNWLTQLWGTRAIMPAGQNVKDHLRAATLTLSQNVTTTYRYAHTGWRLVDGRMVFLSPRGGVGVEGVNVQVPDPLANYGLPTALSGADVSAAIKASVRFLDVGDYWVTMPLWAAMYGAPLTPIIPPSFTLWLYGTTGTMKSTIAALALCHFGRFSYNTPPASWSAGTEVGLRTIAFVLKDTPLWIDDFVSQSTLRGNDELVKKADTLLRDWGNRAGGVKGRADGGLRKVHKPRGIIISTAEMLPPGQSITARLFAVELHPGMLEGGPESKLTAAQVNDVGLYPLAMGAYTVWLGENWDALKAELPKRHTELKEKARQARDHLRGPENVATLAVAFETAMRFAAHTGAISQADADALDECAWNMLVSIGEEQKEIVTVEENPVEMFFRALDQMLAQGAIYLRHAQTDSVQEEQRILPKNRTVGSEMIGYYDQEWLYLLPDVSFRAVIEFYKRSGRVFTDTAMGLKSKLKERQMLQINSGERFRYKLRTGTGNLVWVLKIGRGPIDALMATMSNDDEAIGCGGYMFQDGNNGNNGNNGN